jgi:hypothetical protein
LLPEEYVNVVAVDAVYENIATPAKFGLVVGAAGAEAGIVYGIPTYDGQLQLPFIHTHSVP